MGIENKMLIDGYWPDEDEEYRKLQSRNEYYAEQEDLWWDALQDMKESE